MANKYSRYELQPFPSLYVDNKQPQIAELLANRYDANKTSKDLIDRTLSQLELLDGDKDHLERVKTEVKTSLKDHIDKGDWENSSLVVADAAQLVETDKGLVAANKSMQNRQAEINAMREAKLNGIPMLDFGVDARKAHQSYYYDEEAGTYITNVYEPMMETQLDYRTRKEKMIGKIPASQWSSTSAGVGRGQTNKTANLVVEQYIADTKEGQQEYKKLVDIDLPQSLPREERMRMAKAQILMDFKEVARQQEYNKNTAETGSGNSGAGKDGIVFKSSVDTPINTDFGNMSDKIRGLQERQVALNQIIVAKDATEEQKIAAQNELISNEKMLRSNLASVANQNGEKGKNALKNYNSLVDGFAEYGDDGARLLAATQYLTYNTSAGDTDWGEVGFKALQGGAVAGTAAVAANVIPGAGQVAYGAAIGAGGVAGAITGFGAEMSKDLRNVRDWFRPQETGFLGIDDEREELADVIWNGESLDDGAEVDKINKLLGTNFKEDELENLMSLTDSYYTFMTKDVMQDKDGNEVERMSGDDLFKGVSEKQFTVNQPVLGFGPTEAGKKLRNATNDYAQKEVSVNNPGLQFDGMTVNSGEMDKWIEDIGGAQNLTISGVMLPDIASNTPLRLVFGSSKDMSGDVDRTATITDPTVLKPGGWVYKLLDENFGSGDKVYDEFLRQNYDRAGYENVSMDQFTGDIAAKNLQYAGGGTDEDYLYYKREIEDLSIQNLISNPEFSQFDNYMNPTTGIRGINGQTGFINFRNPDGSFNAAAWEALKDRPAELASIRKTMLETSLKQFGGTDF